MGTLIIIKSCTFAAKILETLRKNRAGVLPKEEKEKKMANNDLMTMDQEELESMWLLGPESRATLCSSTHTGWFVRLSDKAVKIGLADKGLVSYVAQKFVFDPSDDAIPSWVGDLWRHIVYTGRAALYPEMLELSGRFKWGLVNTLSPKPLPSDSEVNRLLAEQSVEAIFGDSLEVERELKFLCKGETPLFDYLSNWSKSKVAEKYPVWVLRIYTHPLFAIGDIDPMEIAKTANFQIRFPIHGELTYEQLLSFNRKVVDPDGNLPAKALLIKEGFSWEVRAQTLVMKGDAGGCCMMIEYFGEPEYDITLAFNPTKWVYVSRSGVSRIEFNRNDTGWYFNGVVSITCIENLVDVGILPKVYLGGKVLDLQALLEAAKERNWWWLS